MKCFTWKLSKYCEVFHLTLLTVKLFLCKICQNLSNFIHILLLLSETLGHSTHGVLNCYMTLCITATVPVHSVSVLAMILPKWGQALIFVIPLSLARLPQKLDGSSFLGLGTTWGNPMMVVELEKRGRETEGSWAPRGTLTSVRKYL